MACEDVIFIPTQGTIEGFVEDNNGVPLSGIQVSATFEAPTQSGQSFPETQVVVTDADGFYRFSELWDEVTFSINQQGFRPFTKLIDLGEDDDLELNLSLEGSPSILTIALDKTTLSVANQDTSNVDIEVVDLYNSQTGIYTGSILVQNSGGGTQTIVPANMTLSSEQQFLLESEIRSEILPIGTYTLVIEIKDPDGNIYQSKTEQQIIVQ